MQHQCEIVGVRRNAIVSLRTLRRSTAMQPSTDYQRFAEECDRLAKNAETERHQKMLEKMADAWRKIAEEEKRRQDPY